MWRDFKVGDKAYLKSGTEIIETEIHNVGRKYIVVTYREYRDKMRFIIDDQRDFLPNVSKYSSLYRLYRTREEAQYALDLQVNKERLRIHINELTQSKLDLESLVKLNNTLKEILNGAK